MPPLVVKEGGFAFPLCPSGQHGLKAVDAFMEPWVYHLLKAIDEANITKYGDGSVNLKLSDEFLYRAVTLVQGGKLPPGSCLVPFRSANISSSSIVNSAHVVSAGFAVS